jgi:hypothetical protein
MSNSLSIANGSLYEACRLRANRWTKIGWNDSVNSNQLYRPEASRILTEAPADTDQGRPPPFHGASTDTKARRLERMYLTARTLQPAAFCCCEAARIAAIFSRPQA